MRVWLCFAMLFLAVPPVAAQKVLPARFAGWQAVAAGSSTATAPEPSPANAALFRACHQQSVEQQVYQRNGATITVTVHRLGDPSYGYSAYSLLRPAPVTDFRPTAHSAVGANEAMLLLGNLLVDISGQNLAADARDFTALAAQLKPHASDEPYPTLWQYLPAERLIPHSDRYALNARTFEQALGVATGPWASGGWVGFEQDDAEAEVAQYRIAGRPATLVLLSYPTSDLAAGHVKEIEKLFDVNPGAKPSGGKPVLYARRTGSLVGLVSGAPSQAAAERLLRQIRYQTVVTWNAPPLKPRQLSMGDYVVGSIYGTFAIIVIAFVAGIALGMIRIVAKRFIPGLVFDRRRSVEILQLGLNSKPIDARDFY
ncbi:MAG TPA: DUF6599 family protein [Candidatus Dormibacteraeota bacterium]|nr:DUF6599 family protein [Candidatus Dormibacteraeota bacterium]